MPVIDPRCSEWVTYQNGTQVHVQSVGYVPAELSDGRLGIYVYAVQKKFPVWGRAFDLLLPGSIDHFATMPEFKIDMAGGGFMPDRGETGPFTVRMGDAQVAGMGLPANRHVLYIVMFNLLKV
jgi:hypothetical protein